MRLHYLQHVPFEGPANVERWATDRGHEVAGTRLFAGESLPGPGEFDWLVVLGGPMGADDEDEYPWLADEKRLVGEALDEGRTVLGVCLGAQVLADALGGEVYPADEPEIGWFPVKGTDGAVGTPFDALPPHYWAFHWHGDTFDLPPGATRVAATDVCANQAFVAGNAVGVQFHLETTPAAADALCEATDQLPVGDRVQSRDEIGAGDDRFAALRERCYALLDALAAERGVDGDGGGDGSGDDSGGDGGSDESGGETTAR